MNIFQVIERLGKELDFTCMILCAFLQMTRNVNGHNGPSGHHAARGAPAEK